MTIREVLVDWTTVNGSGKVSVFWFNAVDPIASQRTALYNLLNNIKTELDDATVANIRNTGREVDEVTGALTGTWTEPTVHTVSGIASGEAVADAVQVLMQWQTGTIVAGRYLRGRTFIPGLSVSKLSQGNLSATSQGVFQFAQSTFVATGTPSAVWHRPSSGSGGVFADVSGGTTWRELAVLRRRRG